MITEQESTDNYKKETIKEQPVITEKKTKSFKKLPWVLAVLFIGAAIIIGITVKNKTAKEITDDNSYKETASIAENNQTEEKNNIVTQSSEEPIRVGIINSDPAESAYREANVNDNINMFTESNGYDAEFFYSTNVGEQIQAARDFIGKGVEYLLLCPREAYGWDEVLTEAKNAGVKVILYDYAIYVDPSLFEACVVSDMAKQGQIAVDWLSEQNLSEYKVIHLQGAMGSDAQIGRTQALDEKIKSDNDWYLVTQQSAAWDQQTAKQIVEDVINTGVDFNVIYAENDNMAYGAAQALDEAGISHGQGQYVKIIGFDCNKWALEEVLNGNWNLDVQCSPFQASYLDKAVKTLEAGGTIAEKYIIIDDKGFNANTITREDVDKYGL